MAGMYSKVLNLAERNGLEAVAVSATCVLGTATRLCLILDVLCGVSAERADFDFACRDGSVGVDDDGTEGVLKLLLRLLCVDVYAR